MRSCFDDYHDGRWRGTIKIDLLHKLVVYVSIKKNILVRPPGAQRICVLGSFLIVNRQPCQRQKPAKASFVINKFYVINYMYIVIKL